MIQKMGSIKDLLGLIPGLGSKFAGLNIDESIFRKYLAIMRSMTQALSTPAAASLTMRRPLRKTVTVSDTASTSSRKCEMKTMLLPLSFRRCSTANNRCGSRSE